MKIVSTAIATLMVTSTMACAPRPSMARLDPLVRADATTTTTEVRDTSTARTGMFVAGGVAGVAAASAVGFTIASSLENSAIKDGGFATGKDIDTAANRGHTFNEVAFLSTGIAALALGATLALYFYSSSSESPARVSRLFDRGGFAF